MRPASEIDRNKLYSIREAAQFLPSVHGGSVCKRTVRNWIDRGLLTSRNLGNNPRYKRQFVLGSELLRFLTGTPNQPPTTAELEAEMDRLNAELDAWEAQ